ncbi:MAG: hypothetical protein ACRC5M_04915 [Anaeroplasmataceae bacterium]
MDSFISDFNKKFKRNKKYNVAALDAAVYRIYSRVYDYIKDYNTDKDLTVYTYINKVEFEMTYESINIPADQFYSHRIVIQDRLTKKYGIVNSYIFIDKYDERSFKLVIEF